MPRQLALPTPIAEALHNFELAQTATARRAFRVELTKAIMAHLPRKPKKQTRIERWGSAAANAVAALEDLVDMQSEFESWHDNLPENLQSSALGEKLDEVCNLDLSSALDTVQEAEGLDLPRGYGKD